MSVVRFLFVALSVLVFAACAPPPQRVADELSLPQASVPSVTPALYVPQVWGINPDWHLNERLIAQLRRYDVAASTTSAMGEGHVLYGVAEAVPIDADTVDVTIYWDFVDPSGELLGTARQSESMTNAEWSSVPPQLDAIAEASAARIINILPGARWELVDPATKVAAREEREKQEERRRLYRKMAARGGLGPLSQRLFLHAEKAKQENEQARQPPNQSASTVPVKAERPAAAGPTADNQDLAAAGARWAQLAAFRSESDARAYWRGAIQSHGGIFEGLRASFPRVDLGENGIFYRVHVGPFADEAAAARFCREAGSVSLACFVAQPTVPKDPTIQKVDTEPAASRGAPETSESGLLKPLGIIALPVGE